jgi:hypothetical protein
MCHKPKCVLSAYVDYLSTDHDATHDNLVHTIEVGLDQNQWCTDVQGLVSVSSFDGSAVWVSLPFSSNETTAYVNQTSHFATE